MGHALNPTFQPDDGKQQKRMWDIMQYFDSWGCPSWSHHFQLIDMEYFRRMKTYGKWIAFVRSRPFGDTVTPLIFLRTDCHKEDIWTYTPSERIICMEPWVQGYRWRGEVVR